LTDDPRQDFGPGSSLAHYRISAKLGEGGMGEVWSATDTRLDREVAIKVLPAAFTADKERLARFEREAKLLAQLNHPNIAQIFGLETSGATHALVMELVPGPTLAERLESGPLSFTESLSFALQITQALEEAHGKGIVHRDLKPQNIKAASEGQLKVLDFGLAKAMDATPGSASAADLARSPTIMNSPTLTAVHGTQLGVILGTAAYMAPEQARGATVDKRADIWAFGVVVFEMLTGRSLFAGDTVSDTLAGVLKTEIDFARLPPATPLALRQLLRRCLERTPKNRLHDIADARIVLQEVAAGTTGDSGPAAATARPQPTLLPWIVAAGTTVAAVALAAALFSGLAGRRATSSPVPTVRFELDWPGTGAGSGIDADYLDLSSDGRFLAVVTQGQIWVRPLDALEARPLAGTGGATYPFFSPDGSTIGFFADNELRRIPRDGGTVQKLCDAPDARGGAWAPDGTIVFSDRFGKEGLFRVGNRGGKAVALPRVAGATAPGEDRYPQFLPDGRRFLFVRLSGSPEEAGVYVGDLDGGPPLRVLDGSENALYAPASASGGPGYLLSRRQGLLTAWRFDAARLRTVGEPFPLGLRVGSSGNTGHGAFTVSTNGVLVHSELSVEREIVSWLDRAGRPISPVTGRLAIRGFELSPDGRTLAYGHGDYTVRRDIWLQPMAGGAPARFTFGDGPGWAFPAWSPDGAEIAYATQDRAGEGKYEIRRRRLDRSGAEQTLYSNERQVFLWDWSPDGRHLVYTDDRDSELWLLPLAEGAKPIAFTSSPEVDECAQFSPDGRYLAYTTTLAGHRQVFLQPVPPTGALWQVTTGGGDMPRWRGDGRELFYRKEDGTLTAVAVENVAGALAFGAPRALFSGILSLGNTAGFSYLPAADGQRFLVSQWDEASRSPLAVTLHWQNDLSEAGGGL